MKDDVFLTTLDNPSNPFEQFEQWYAFDIQKGYNTCGYLARIARSSDELSDADEDRIVEEAIDEIVELNILGIYKKVKKSDKRL
jgi:hypothetical protein